MIIHLSLKTTLWDSYYYYLHITDEGIKYREVTFANISEQESSRSGIKIQVLGSRARVLIILHIILSNYTWREFLQDQLLS